MPDTIRRNRQTRYAGRRRKGRDVTITGSSLGLLSVISRSSLGREGGSLRRVQQKYKQRIKEERYTRIETERAGRHLPRPYGEQDIGLRMTRVCRTRWSNRPHAEGGQRCGKPPTPRALPPTKKKKKELCPLICRRQEEKSEYEEPRHGGSDGKCFPIKKSHIREYAGFFITVPHG